MDSAYASGDVVAATLASQSARSLNIAGIVIGSVGTVLVVILVVIILPTVFATSSESDDNYYN